MNQVAPNPSFNLDTALSGGFRIGSELWSASPVKKRVCGTWQRSEVLHMQGSMNAFAPQIRHVFPIRVLDVIQ
jgi:hypothetical protein